MYALVAGEKAVCTAMAGERHQIVIGGIVQDNGRDVLRIRDDLTENQPAGRRALGRQRR